MHAPPVRRSATPLLRRGLVLAVTGLAAANKSILYYTRAATTICVVEVAVIAFFWKSDEPISADWDAEARAAGARESLFDLACTAATIVGNVIPIITAFWALYPAIAADELIALARLAFTKDTSLDATFCVAAVSPDLVCIVALLCGGEYAISADWLAVCVFSFREEAVAALAKKERFQVTRSTQKRGEEGGEFHRIPSCWARRSFQ